MIYRDNSPPCYTVGKADRSGPPRKDRDLQNVGPFNYDKSFADRRQQPRYSMGAKLESLEYKKRFQPAPNNYDPTQGLTKLHSPNWKIGSSPRQPCYNEKLAALNPGPNNYEITPIAFVAEAKRSRFHQGVKLFHDDPTKFIHSVPAPNNYTPSTELSKQKSPLYSMGAKFHKTQDFDKLVPGPGSYHGSCDRLKKSSPSFGFGTSKRP